MKLTILQIKKIADYSLDISKGLMLAAFTLPAFRAFEYVASFILLGATAIVALQFSLTLYKVIGESYDS